VGTQKFQVEESETRGQTRIVLVNGKPIAVEILTDFGKAPVDLLLRAGGRTFHITVNSKDEQDRYSIDINGKPVSASLERFEEVRLASSRATSDEGPIIVTAPMAGRVASLNMGVGDAAEEGQALLVLQAMKMENEVASPKMGVVREVYVHPGDLVKSGDKLVLIE